MAILTRAEILAAKDLNRELVEVREWGGEVYVRGLTAAELDRYQASMLQQRGKSHVANFENVRAKLVALCSLDENGERIFTDADVKALSGKSGAAVNRIFEVAQRLSGIEEDDIQEMTGALEENPFGASPSD